MNTVQELKEAVGHLSAQEQLELAEWLANSEKVRHLRLDELRREISIGIAQAEQGQLRDSSEVFRRTKQEHANKV